MRRLLLFAFALGILVALPSPASATHGADVDCPDFATQRAAQDHLLAHPGDPDGLDGDNDGTACQSLPCPCGASGTTPAPPPPSTAHQPPPPAAQTPPTQPPARGSSASSTATR